MAQLRGCCCSMVLPALLRPRALQWMWSEEEYALFAAPAGDAFDLLSCCRPAWCVYLCDKSVPASSAALLLLLLLLLLPLCWEHDRCDLLYVFLCTSGQHACAYTGRVLWLCGCTNLDTSLEAPENGVLLYVNA
jgi:hypothetical protein